MPYLLAIESSGKPLSLALFKDSALVEEVYKEPDGRGHSETLLPLIHDLLTRHALTLPQIDSFAIASGPGSYTSLRVGMATLMGLLAKDSKPVYAVSTLKAMAWGAKTNAPYVAPVLAGGRGRVYAAVYERQSLNALVPDSPFEPAAFVEKLSPFSKALLVGPGISLLGGSIANSTDLTLTPRAAQIGFLALQGIVTPIATHQLKLAYLQEPDFG